MLESGDRADHVPSEHAAQAHLEGRRAALMRLGALCGLALGGDVLAAVTLPRKAQAGLLTGPELALTAVLADLVIPRTDTPGARDVGAHHVIDHLLQACAPELEQAQYRAGLARIDDAAGQPFAALPAAHQVALLHALDRGTAPFNDDDMRFFRKLKGYVAFAYYTSEAGASRELAYLPFPGGFDGHVKVTPSTRTWAI
jgi:hypothetical protein